MKVNFRRKFIDDFGPFLDVWLVFAGNFIYFVRDFVLGIPSTNNIASFYNRFYGR